MIFPNRNFRPNGQTHQFSFPFFYWFCLISSSSSWALSLLSGRPMWVSFIYICVMQRSTSVFSWMSSPLLPLILAWNQDWDSRSFTYSVVCFIMCSISICCSAILNMQFAILLKEYSMVIIFLFILKTTLRLSFISHYRKSKRSSKQEYGWEIVSSILTQVRPIQPVHMFISIAESCWLYLKRIILCFFTQCTTVMSDKGFFSFFYTHDST